jgi:hypothetical protein
MTKRSQAVRKSRTHFEQIPLEVVKKIAEGDVPKDEEAGTDNVSVESVSTKSGPGRVPARSPERKRR